MLDYLAHTSESCDAEEWLQPSDSLEWWADARLQPNFAEDFSSFGRRRKHFRYQLNFTHTHSANHTHATLA